MIIAIITATRKTVGTAEILPVYKTVLSVQDKSACKSRQTTPSQCGLSGKRPRQSHTVPRYNA